MPQCFCYLAGAGAQSHGELSVEFRFGATVLRVNVPDRRRLHSLVRARLRTGRGFALATLNLDHLVKLATDRRFRDAYARHDLIVADGNPVVWLSRLARRPVGLVPGSDLVCPLAVIAAQEGVPLALVGSTRVALARASERLRRAAPGLRVAALISPEFGFDPEGEGAEALIDEIAASGAGLCLLALGAPKQEILAARARARLPGIGFVSVGAGLDFLAGSQRRAPLWLRRLALEWAWRMLSDPLRLGPRYLRCALILPLQAMAALRLRMRGAA